jgi:hypothetical protein
MSIEKEYFEHFEVKAQLTIGIDLSSKSNKTIDEIKDQISDALYRYGEAFSFDEDEFEIEVQEVNTNKVVEVLKMPDKKT